MFQSIETKFIGPSNTRGSRVMARCDAGKRYYSWDHSKNSDENHTEAARKFAHELGWAGAWRGGSTKDGYAFVSARFLEDAPDFTIATDAEIDATRAEIARAIRE